MNRRNFMQAVGAGAVACSWATARGNAKKEPLRLAIVTTEWRYRSHAWHMGERFLTGYPRQGQWHHPPLKVVAAYVDQFPENDLSRQRAKDFGFTIYPSVAEALRQGTDKLAVDAVLIIGEHGKYHVNEFGQTQYPRYEFFKSAVEVFEKDGRVVPIFNDKHLSWNWDWAKEMVDISRRMKIPFLAGSSLPVTWRMPAIDMPNGAEIEEAMCLAIGSVDSYDFHALEVLQCMVERRKGGETGVKSVQALRGDAVWQSMQAGSFESGGWDQDLFKACLCRSQTLHQAETNSHRYPSDEQIREWVKEPIAYRMEYNDGLKTTMLMMNGLVEDFNFAARIKGQSDPLSTLFYLPPGPNVAYSAALMSKAEELFVTGKPPYPIERTLLTTGLVAAGVHSLKDGGKRLDTPHLDVTYTPPHESQFWHD